jgi:hypothetical protein
LLIATGFVAPERLIRIGAGLMLLGWAAYHWRYGHRHRVRFGMQTGLWGLAAWSFLMATAHGAGLMLWPVLMPLCAPGTAVSEASLGALAGVGIHTAAMILTTAVIAVLVYEWLGLGLLRRAWINVDLLWTGALVVTGVVLMFV